MESKPDAPPSSKPPVSTLVFMDLETTGLPGCIGKKNVHITEISLVAVDRLDFENDKSALRVINKLSICVQPRTTISYGAMKVTGLSNDILETQQVFNDSVPKLLDTFLSRLRRPVCLLAHNGHGYDFPILQSELQRLNCSLPEDILCADTLEAFRKIGLVPPNDAYVTNTTCEDVETSNHSVCNADLTDDDIEKLLSEDIHLLENISVPHEPQLTYNYNTHKYSNHNSPTNQNNFNIGDIQISTNNAVEVGSGECTPIKTGIAPPVNGVYYASGKVEITPQSDHWLSDNNQELRNATPAKRRLFEQMGNDSKKIVIESPPSNTVNSQSGRSSTKKKLSKKPQYSLEKLYIHYFGEMPPDSHHAESDCINLSKVCQKVSMCFLPWLDEHSFPFHTTSALW